MFSFLYWCEEEKNGLGGERTQQTYNRRVAQKGTSGLGLGFVADGQLNRRQRAEQVGCAFGPQPMGAK